MFLKPACGVHGRAILRVTREGERVRDHVGISRTPLELLEQMQGSGYEVWLAQEVLSAHAAIAELSGSSCLQTARVVTYLDKTETIRLLAGRLRLVNGEGVVDNFGFGVRGNLIGTVHCESGVLERVVGKGAGGTLCSVDHHPKTGASLQGFRVPGWPDVKELAMCAAEMVRPLKTVAWDIGITNEGPVLVEGNATWDPLTGYERMGELYRFMKADAGRYNDRD